MKHLFIVNPVAGGKDHTGYVTAQAAQAFARREGEYEIYVTRGPRDAIAKVRAEAQLVDELRVFACGGDGTLNECVRGAAGIPNAAVTHLPCGTGNDFIKMFGAEAALFSDVGGLLDGEVRPIDLIAVNDSYSVNICSVGVDARIGTDVHKYSRLPLIGGSAGYVVSVGVNFFKGISDELTIDCCGQKSSGRFATICACNGRFYGGGFNPVPDARPDDGVIDFLIVRDVSRLAFAKLIGDYAKGHYDKYPQYITRVSGSSLDIHSESELVINVDGEAEYAYDVHMRVVPGGVNFIFPRELAFFPEDNAKKEAIASKSN